MNIQELSPPDFPLSLRHIPQVPKKLWLRGSLPSPNIKMLAIVGSRALSPYGRHACEMLISGLAGYPISIVSGLALGADACAHRAALAVGLHTVAVLGSGVNDEVIGPRTNFELAKDILASGGGILSENPVGHIASPFDFPQRNRIMVGLSQAVLVIEAGRDSGTLITTKYTSEYNRELLCVPHRIGDPHSRAAEVYARIGGVPMIYSSEQLLEVLEIELRKPEAQRALPLLTAAEQLVHEALIEPQSRDYLLRTTPLPSGEILTALTSLELKGIIIERFGSWNRI